MCIRRARRQTQSRHKRACASLRLRARAARRTGNAAGPGRGWYRDRWRCRCVSYPRSSPHGAAVSRGQRQALTGRGGRVPRPAPGQAVTGCVHMRVASPRVPVRAKPVQFLAVSGVSGVINISPFISHLRRNTWRQCAPHTACLIAILRTTPARVVIAC